MLIQTIQRRPPRIALPDLLNAHRTQIDLSCLDVGVPKYSTQGVKVATTTQDSELQSNAEECEDSRELPLFQDAHRHSSYHARNCHT